MFDSITSGIGLWAAIIAAATGTFNLFLQMKGKTDKFIVRYDSVYPRIEEGHQFSIISISDHPVHITDFGYLQDDLVMCSIGIEQELGHLLPHQVSVTGKRHLDHHGQVFDVGVQLSHKPLAVYGWSATQRRPKVAFHRNAKRWDRIRVKTKLLLSPNSLF